MRKLIFASTFEADTKRELSITFLRVFAGLVMALTHGYGKLPPNEQLIGGVASMGFPAPEFFAWAAALAEFVGGLCLAVGLLTRPAAIFLGFTMFMAAFNIHLNDPFAAKEMSLLYLAICVVFAVRGGSKFSADAFLG